MASNAFRSTYSTRLTRGGALLPLMRSLVLVWERHQDTAAALEERVAGVDRRRLAEVIRDVFLPRYVASAPPNLWQPLAVFEHAGWSRDDLRPLHYWATAAAEPLLADFVLEVLGERRKRGATSVAVADLTQFLDNAGDRRFPSGRWGPATIARIARNALAALRDFGILQGAAKKRLTPVYVPVHTFAFLAFLVTMRGARAKSLLTDRSWALFFFAPSDVERLLVEAQQEGWLHFHTAGSVVRVDFPAADPLGYARYLAQGTNRLARA